MKSNRQKRREKCYISSTDLCVCTIIVRVCLTRARCDVDNVPYDEKTTSNLGHCNLLIEL